MKKLILILIIAFTALTIQAQKLPQTKINTPTGIIVHSYHLQSGDTVFTYYIEGGNKYISGKIPIDIDCIMKGFVMSSFNNQAGDDYGITASSGNIIGHPIYMGVKRNGALYDFNPIDIKTGQDFDVPVDSIYAANLKLYKMDGGIVTGNFEGELKPVPWFDAYNALCPIEGEKEYIIDEAVVGESVFIPHFKPTLCKSYTMQLIKGNGEFYKYNSYTDTYKFGEGDPQLGEIVIRYTAIPFSGCNEDALIYESKIKYKAEQDAKPKTYNKGKFYKAVKSHLKAEKTGNKVHVFYDNTQTNDFDFPVLKFILYSKPPMKELDAEESTNTKPDVILTIPSGKKPFYIKVIAKDYGDFQNIYIR